MSPDTPLFVVPRCTLFVVLGPGSTLFVLPRLATTLLAASSAASGRHSRVHSARAQVLILVIFFVEERADPVLGIQKEIASVAPSTIECVLRVICKVGFVRLIGIHYIERSENNGLDEIPSTGLEPAILTLGGSRLIQLGYEG